jgi:hypothetical protein
MWLFIVAPITGAVIAGASYAFITGAPSAAVGIAENPELDTHEQTAERSGQREGRVRRVQERLVKRV